MKAPLSERVKKMLADKDLSEQLMKAIIADRSNVPDEEKPTIIVDGKELRLVRVRSTHRSK